MIDIVTYGGKVLDFESTKASGKSIDSNTSTKHSPYRIVDVNEEGKDSFEIWLSHIISQYDKLADYTLFLSNSPVENTKFKDGVQLLSVLEIEPSLFLDKTQWCKNIRCDENGAPHHPGLSLKPWWTELFPEMTPPPIFDFVQGAQRMMSKEKIQKRPRTFYENVLGSVLKGESSHFVLERLWMYI